MLETGQADLGQPRVGFGLAFGFGHAAEAQAQLDVLEEVAVPGNIEVFKRLKQQIAIELSPEGLRVQLLDTDKRPMFELGSARVAPYMSQLLRTFAPVLNELHNRIQISGHTDSHPYSGGEAGYSNWDLSADRAKASRQELVAGGLDPEKLLRVSGMSDRIRFHGAGPFDAVNRRIEIIVLDSQVAERILNQEEYTAPQAGQSGQ